MRLLTDIPQGLSGEELDALLEKLPPWRREKALSYRFDIDRELCARAYLLLCRGMLDEYGIRTMPAFGYGPCGKPFLPEYPDIHFNLSHCRSGVMCVLHDGSIGCDIESIPATLDADLCRWCFDDVEIARIQAAERPCEEFTRLWTMKEAYLKLTGDGLQDNLPSLLTPEILATVDFDTTVDLEHGHVYTTCRHSRNSMNAGSASGQVRTTI